MAYSILLAPPAERQLKAFSQAVQKRLVKRLKRLQANPRPQGVKKLVGGGDLYRVREGDYRIIYTIRDKALIVLVLKFGDRKEVYRS
ncbi:MAG TPA: type II toxin-antitoxin system RelE/ParE family toxin [Nitrospirales bacterium]|nr:type II toxin-antitoxin system mRNA interferase toxin, RelE/StbE family [Nitrospiraceae bacterium]HNP30872.1 type II toxin-antitoxin system RelE/ParE family toxin [Nitrospirales bacterium]